MNILKNGILRIYPKRIRAPSSGVSCTNPGWRWSDLSTLYLPLPSTHHTRLHTDKMSSSNADRIASVDKTLSSVIGQLETESTLKKVSLKPWNLSSGKGRSSPL